MKRIVLALALLAFGCAPVVRTAVPLTPANPNGDGAWVFVDTDDTDSTGVYYCTNTTEPPKCTRARLND